MKRKITTGQVVDISQKNTFLYNSVVSTLDTLLFSIQTQCQHYDFLHHLQNSEQTRQCDPTEGTESREEQHHYLFIMGNQLGLHMARHEIHSPQHLPCLQPPDGTGCINAGGTWKQSVHVSS